VSQQTNKQLAVKLNNIASVTVSSALIPVVTKNGILVGSYTVKPDDGSFVIVKNKHEYYRTYTKSAAMIIAGFLNKNIRTKDISAVLDADRIASAMRNDIDSYKYHYELANANGDDIKKQIMMARFEVANDRYKEAKRVLKNSYSKLF
jgi:hypothetical protein